MRRLFRSVAGLAFRIDEWLHERLGKPYRIFLSIGLVLDIVHRATEIPEHFEAKHKLVAMALAMVLEIGLLIHQVAEFHTRLGPKKAKAE